jgi:riboflavin synthase
MFTGIIEEIGRIEKVRSLSEGKLFYFSAHTILEDLMIDDSVSVNGVCLTVTNISNNSFTATAVQETLNRSTLGKLPQYAKVNFERALKIDSRLGGHIVQGHADGVGKTISVENKGTGKSFKIEIPDHLMRYIIEKGSITIDGISLTVASISQNRITIWAIPHTLQQTTLSDLKAGSLVNIEVDLVGKYVERFISHHLNDQTQTINKKPKKDEHWLRSLGYE